MNWRADMAVHFVYRSAYETPLGRRIVQFPDESLRAWFHRNWVTADDLPGYTTDFSQEWLCRAADHTERMLGGSVYGFHAIWAAMLELPQPPESEDDMVTWLDGIAYPEGQVQAQPHMLQIPTDDDELDLAVLMFDGDYAMQHPDRASYPLWKHQALPDTIAESADTFSWDGPVNDLLPHGNSDGDVYLIFVVIHDTSWLIDLYGAFRFRGLRLPGLVEHLQSNKPKIAEQEAWFAWIPSGTWPHEMRLLRWAAINSPHGVGLGTVLRDVDSLDPDVCVEYVGASRNSVADPDMFLLGDFAVCRQEWQDVEKRRKQAALTSKRQRQPTYFQVTPHLAQLGFTDGSADSDSPRGNLNTQWIMFDDLWAASHPDLASSLLWWACEQLPL